MSYTARVERKNPTCFLILLDQSGSMADIQGGSNQQKAQGASDAVNRILHDMVIRCTDGLEVRNYFDIGLIGYGEGVRWGLGGELAGRELVPISEIADLPSRVDERVRRESDGVGGIVEVPARLPIWLDPVASGGTPMCEAISVGRRALSAWIQEHPQSFPPVVINITDGEATDGEPLGGAQELKGLKTDDRAVLVFNCHLSSKQAPPVLYPSSDESLVDDYARLLFQMSSILPEPVLSVARNEGFSVNDGARGFVFQAQISDLAQFLKIGTEIRTDLR